MKRLLIILLLVLCALPALPTTSKAIGISVNLGDRPYYHGPYYYGPRHERLYWVPGHWSRRHHRHQRVWIHGQYIRR